MMGIECLTIDGERTVKPSLLSLGRDVRDGLRYFINPATSELFKGRDETRLYKVFVRSLPSPVYEVVYK